MTDSQAFPTNTRSCCPYEFRSSIANSANLQILPEWLSDALETLLDPFVHDIDYQIDAEGTISISAFNSAKGTLPTLHLVIEFASDGKITTASYAPSNEESDETFKASGIAWKLFKKVILKDALSLGEMLYLQGLCTYGFRSYCKGAF